MRARKNKSRSSHVRLSEAQRAELQAHLPLSGWKLLSVAELPSVFAVSLQQKIDSALLIASGSSDGTTYMVFNAFRVDTKAAAIDQEPFGIVFSGSVPEYDGVFIHHGDWTGRTSSPGPDFWNQVLHSGVGGFFLTNPPEGKLSGTLDELPTEHQAAFESVVKKIREK